MRKIEKYSSNKLVTIQMKDLIFSLDRIAFAIEKLWNDDGRGYIPIKKELDKAYQVLVKKTII